MAHYGDTDGVHDAAVEPRRSSGPDSPFGRVGAHSAGIVPRPRAAPTAPPRPPETPVVPESAPGPDLDAAPAGTIGPAADEPGVDENPTQPDKGRRDRKRPPNRVKWTPAQSWLAVVLVVLVTSGVSVLTGPRPSTSPDTAVWLNGIPPTPGPTLPATGPPIGVPAGALDLTDATLTLPTLPENFAACQGQVTMVANVGRIPAADGTGEAEFALHVTREWVGDLNRDGTADTLAQVVCGNGDATLWQLIAVTPSTPSTPRSPLTLGQIVASGPAPAPATLFDLTVAADGTVQADVGDLAVPDQAQQDQLSVHQRRSYRWNGRSFAQVAGPHTFPANPNFYDLAVTTSALRLGAASGGRRNGVLTVNVRNAGAGRANQVKLTVAVPAVYALTGPQEATQLCHGGTDPAGQVLTCDLGTMAAGASRTLYLDLADPAGDTADPAPTSRLVTVRGTDQFNLGLSLDQLADNDQTTFQVTRG